ncbi:hypothetical protein [Actinoplanes couchii]|uniref:hypothetical protein n=1 Tax=Actinoplanes couchii TaxID=403638 RepID=UPI0019405305|nr:hypothetical protein [Actinoplanes couchii]MDR6318115.1 hypothetical protein [Actinoplanes couchii]
MRLTRSVMGVPQNWQLAIATWCIATILGLLGIAVSVSNSNQVLVLRLASIALGLTAVIFLISAFCRALVLVRRMPLGGRQLPGLQVGVHGSRWASSSRDIADAHQFLESFLPYDPPSLALMKTLHRHNSLTTRLIERKVGARRELVGMLVVAPLKKGAVKDFRDSKIIDVSDIGIVKCIPKSWLRPYGMYIGGVAGKGPAARAWVLSFIELLAQQTGVQHVFARPASPDGLRVLKASGFSQLPHPSPFWHIELPV